jgi:hypothetical protein
MITDSVAKNRSWPSSVLKNEAGAALVEASLIMIPFLLLLFGVIEFGLLLYDQQVLNNAAREGARAGIVVSTFRSDTPEFDAVIQAEVINYAKKHLVTFGTDIITIDDIVITKITGPKNLTEDSSGKIVPGPWGNFDDILIVSASYTYKFLFLSNFKIPAITLNSSNSAARMELE